ncbi:unnamed protein product [Dovyalis caffra]|uniref:Ribosome-binding factor A, chloroplastic n=1 Tax=Dovyalis caffra TaxID=77055 RepID=A0AAV1R879_9ROSI|nr:unnamed protein product [Dovyalis caffra]
MLNVQLHHLRQTQPLLTSHPNLPPFTTVHSTSFPIRSPKSMVPIHFQKPLIYGTTIKCMAKPRRVKMVAKQIQRELSDMLLTDKVLQYAILPEAALGADRYLSSLTTISDVEVSADLQVVKVFVSVFGDDRGKEVAIAGLKSKAKYVRSELGRRMKLRLTPEVRFIEDESLERGSRVIALLDRIKAEKDTAEIEGDMLSDPSDPIQDDKNWGAAAELVHRAEIIIIMLTWTEASLPHFHRHLIESETCKKTSQKDFLSKFEKNVEEETFLLAREYPNGIVKVEVKMSHVETNTGSSSDAPNGEAESDNDDDSDDSNNNSGDYTDQEDSQELSESGSSLELNATGSSEEISIQSSTIKEKNNSADIVEGQGFCMKPINVDRSLAWYENNS